MHSTNSMLVLTCTQTHVEVVNCATLRMELGIVVAIAALGSSLGAVGSAWMV